MLVSHLNMGVEQIIVNNAENIEFESFKRVFGSSVKGNINTGEGLASNLNDFYKSISYKSDNLGVIVSNCLDTLGVLRGNIMYLYLPNLPVKQQEKFIKNYYLHLISCQYANVSERKRINYTYEINSKYNTEINSNFTSNSEVIRKSHEGIYPCVNTVKVFLNDTNETIIEKYLQKNGLCYGCFERLPENIQGLVGNMT